MFFASCAGMNQINPAALKGNHARGNFVNKTFLGAWGDYQRYAVLENLTEEAKVLLKQKRAVLKEFVNPLYGPIILFNRSIAGEELITDAAWDAMLDKLVALETGWYVNGDAYTGKSTAMVQKLDPKVILEKFKPEQQTDAVLNQIIQAEATRAKIRKDTGTEAQALWEGLLIELIRTGIHALRAMLAQRNMTDEQLGTAWTESWTAIQALNAESLVVIQ
jgi:hypothetical protein